MYCQGKPSSRSFFLPVLLFFSLLYYSPSPSHPFSGSPSVSSQRPYLLSLPRLRILLPSNPARLPFKGTEISFGDIKPPFNRLLIQVGFSNFFPRLSCLLRRPKRAVVPLFVCVSHAETAGTRGCKQLAVIPSRSYPTVTFASREGIGTVNASDRLLPSLLPSFSFSHISRYFILSWCLSAVINRVLTFHAVNAWAECYWTNREGSGQVPLLSLVNATWEKYWISGV